MSTPTPLFVALALAAVVIPAAADRAGHHLTGHAVQGAPAPAALGAALPLTVQGATVVAVPPGATETSAFMTLRNAGNSPVTLTGVQTPAAGHAMLMHTRRDAQGRTGMSAVKTLTVPARGTLRLSAAGDHLMLMDLTRPLKVGETVRLTLSAGPGRRLNVDAVVRKP
ncbi:copper chaperone PCu(A)C [Deinococcus planocerae]|uniref:copper chaperone PCu(A)C n=1 Tax=Deinococcus planocerae TaxID=1737569 RepID=UPI000C7F2084|nr:copper chaperone PCu(A)C [Deinococcus planocerae]